MRKLRRKENHATELHYGPWLPAFLGDTFSYSRKAGAAAVLKDLDVPRGGIGTEDKEENRGGTTR